LVFLLENILNLIGFAVGLVIGIMSYIGFKNTGSPTLFRLAIAFFSISIGFFVIWSGYMVDDFILKTGHTKMDTNLRYCDSDSWLFLYCIFTYNKIIFSKITIP